MVELIQVGTATGTVLIFALAMAIKSYKGGYLGNVIQNHRDSGTQVNGKLDSIEETVEETYQETRHNGEQIDDLGEAIFLLHRNDAQVDERELRDKVGVDGMSTDIFDQGQSDD